MSAAAAVRAPRRGSATGRVLLSAWQAQRGRRFRLWLVPVLGVATMLPALFGLLAGGAASGLLRLLFALASVPLVVGTVVLWLLLAFNLLLQNDPQLARTLPGHVATLRRALVAAAALLACAVSLLAATRGGPVLLAATATAAGCAALATGLRWPMLWLPMVLPLWVLPSMLNRELMANAERLWDAWAWPVAGATGLLATLALRSLILTGTPAHEKAHARLQAMYAADRGQTTAAGRNNPLAQALPGGGTRGARAWYAAHLRRLLNRPDSPVLARLALGMGPQAHWTGALANHLLGIAMVLLFAALSMLFPDWKAGGSVRTGLALGLIAGTMASVVQLPAALWNSRREQVLLRLLPQAPQAAALNRWLALRLAGIQLLLCGALTAALLIVAGFTDIETLWPQTTAAALATMVLSLLLVPLLWRDWSRLRAPSGVSIVQLLAALLIFGSTAFVWVRWLGWPWWALGGVTAALLLPLAAWRWHALGRMPAAWPAGRLST